MKHRLISILKKLLKPVIYAAVVVLVVSFILILISATRPDAPPFDDSALAIPKIKVDDSANGFIYLIKNVQAYPDLDDELFKICINRNLTDKQAHEYKSKYGGYLNKLHKSSEFDEFYSPLISMSYHDYEEFTTHMHDLFSYTSMLLKIDKMLIWKDFRDGKSTDAINLIETWLRLAGKLQNSYSGYEESYHLGSFIQWSIYNEVNKFAESGLATDRDIVQIAAILLKYSDFSSGLMSDLKSTYYGAMNDVTHICKRDYKTPEEILLCVVSFNEKATMKMIYDDLLPFKDAAGKPYKDFPRSVRDIFSDDSPETGLFEKLLRGNERGLSFNRDNEYEIHIIFSYLHSAHNETISNALQLKLALIQYYHQNHVLPHSLTVLVPEYIQAIPRDPYDGRPMRYNPDKKIIYSVGSDLKDDKGIAAKDIFDIYPFWQGKKDIVLPIMPIKKKDSSGQSDISIY